MTREQSARPFQDAKPLSHPLLYAGSLPPAERERLRAMWREREPQRTVLVTPPTSREVRLWRAFSTVLCIAAVVGAVAAILLPALLEALR